MTDWYRRKTWTKTDEEEFFSKLARARKDSRAQYLKIQAIELIETKSKLQLEVAEILLNRILTEYPDNKFDKAQTLNSLGEIYLIRKQYDIAITYFQQALNFEKEYPNVKTTAYLKFAEAVILAEKTEFYREVERRILEEIETNSFRFPIQNYVMFSVLSIIFDYHGNVEKAGYYAELAEKNATAETNTLWNPRKRQIGIVKERKTVLDKLLKVNKLLSL